jgi:acyl-CoA synthetase (AMP-forming)/AMP-acid ligase II
MTGEHDVTVVTAFERVAERRRDEVALVHEGTRLTYGNIVADSRRLSAGLRELGVRRGDRVLFVARNRVEHVTWLLAVTRLGALHAPVHHDWTAPELRRVIEEAEPRVIAVEGARAETIAEAVRGTGTMPVVDLDDETQVGDLASAGAVELDEGEPAGDCTLWFTSGTSGRPKGVVWTHRAFLFNALAINRVAGIGPDDVGLRVSPMSHNGMSSAVVGTAMCGAPVHLLARFDAARVLELIADEGVTWTNLVPAAARLLLDAAADAGVESLPSLRRLLVGAAPTPPGLLERLVRFLPSCAVLHGYGATEGYMAVCRPEHGSRTDGSVGEPLPGTQIRVVDDDGKPVPPGTVGRIMLSSPGLMRCYWRNPEATAAALSDDGWLEVGDLGHLDESGALFVLGRSADVINCGGYNVYASEVEAALCRQPGVGGAAVVGEPDEIMGESVVAFVEPEDGATLTPEYLHAACDVELARYKRPSRIAIVEHLPRNSYDKILKNQLVGGSR